MTTRIATIDGNEAAVYTAYRLNEIIAIYPITPSSSMGELSDEWSADGVRNIWGTAPVVVEMQSEGGAAGAVHGALSTGSLTTTFTSSQGLLLMIPNMYKIAGELTPTVFHVAARALSAQAISIYGDHSDVMATRATGFALLASRSVQEAHDMALICQAATLESRIPFLHFFDGFRTSHEVTKIQLLSEDDMRAMIRDEWVVAHRQRGLSPDRGFIRGTLHNQDVYFQGRESVNPFYLKCPEIVQGAMDRFAALTGRSYRLFDYCGTPDADRVIILMGSGAVTAEETAKALNRRGEKVGVVTVHLYRPFAVDAFIRSLPATVKSLAVLDRTKEPGSAGEPLYLDIVAAIDTEFASPSPRILAKPRILSGRYGLAGKEFSPAMVKATLDEISREEPRRCFTVGIHDDVSHTSLAYDPGFSIEAPETIRCLFYGMGSDGTVSANKNAVKIIGEETEYDAQGYFVYDSKKSGSITISHLRFGPHPIHAPYLVEKANFTACHQFSFLERLDVTRCAAPGGVFLLNSPYGPAEVWDRLPEKVQKDILGKKLRFYVIDAYDVAAKTGMGSRINTIMQTCFFAISGVLDREAAVAKIKENIRKSYGKRGETVVQQNYHAVDQTLAHLYEVAVPEKATAGMGRDHQPNNNPKYVHSFIEPILAFEGDRIPVSAMPPDGTYPSGTARWEKRNIALEIPVWEPDLCIQCGKCVFVCPHAALRQKVYVSSFLKAAPATFRSLDAKFKEFPGMKYSLQVAPEDCTGCGLCVEACPAKDKQAPDRKALGMADQIPLRAQECENWTYFLTIPEVDRTKMGLTSIKNAQLLQPLFEFSGACTGCGETPYLKLISQLFGDRAIIANATGCSSVYGGSLPTTPWSVNADGRGPAWSNSLFEDNAEFGLGMRLTVEKQAQYAAELLKEMAEQIGPQLASEILEADQKGESGILAQRERIEALKQRLGAIGSARARLLASVADALVRKSVWIVGGDGWAYDIGYGGLDHVLASGRNVNVLVLDTEVYSNTGGQASKSTPIAAVAKFAADGKGMGKKDLGMMAMSYGHVYVAEVAFGANDQQTLHAFLEAEAYAGPSLIIAYSHCIAHGIDTRNGLQQQKLAVQSGVWPLYRFNPDRTAEGKNPLSLDSKAPTIPVEAYAYQETRYRMLLERNEGRAENLMREANQRVLARWKRLCQLAENGYAHSP